MPSEVTIRRARAAGGVVVTVTGTLDLATVARLQAVLEHAAPGRSVAVDLCALEVTDATAVALLVGVIRRLRRGRRVIVACPEGAARSALERTGVARRLVVVGTPDAAEAALAEEDDRDAGGGVPQRPSRIQRPATGPRRRQLLIEAMVVLEADHADPELSLEQVARRIATSARQLQRVFAELAQTSFRDELSAVRMQHAAELLQSTDLPVGAIAAQVGHRQAAQFAKAFRRHHGLPPAAFRAAARAEARRAGGESYGPT